MSFRGKQLEPCFSHLLHSAWAGVVLFLFQCEHQQRTGHELEEGPKAA